MLIRLTAAAVVERDGHYLLVEESAQGRIVLNNPSGRWEPGETLPDTARREAAEEAGVLFSPDFLVGSYVTTHATRADQHITTVRFAFGGEINPGTPSTPRDSAILGLHWLTFEELIDSQSRHRSQAVLRCIADYRSGRRYPLSAVKHFGQGA